MKVFSDLSTQELRQLDLLLDEYLDLPEGTRVEWLQNISEQHPELAIPLRKMAGEGPNSAENETRSPVTLEPGTMVGAWRIQRWHASGGSSDVYCAERADGSFERTAAIKFLNQVSAGWQSRFLREQQFLAKLSHPNIVGILDAGRYAGQAFLGMPWMHGQSFAEFLQSNDWRKRVGAVIEICDAVAHAHQRLVIHRDLKPSNIVFVDSRPMLLDFGVAKLLDGDLQSTQNFFTPSYACPEQLLGGEIGVACDIHAIGLILFELLSGKPAFPKAQLGLAHAVDAIVHQQAPSLLAASKDSSTIAANKNLANLIPKVALRDLQAILNGALAKQPEERYLSATQLSADLQSVLAGDMISVRKRTTASSIGYWVRRNPIAAGALSVALLASVLGFASYVAQNQKIAAERESALLQVQRLESLREHFTLILREGVAQQGLGAKAALDESVQNLSTLYAGQPLLRAEVLATLGELYVSAGDYLAAQSALAPLAKNVEFSALPSKLRSKTLESLTTSSLRLGNHESAESWLAQWQSLVEPGTADFAEWQIAKATWLRQTGEPGAALQLQSDAVTQLFEAADSAPLAQGIARANLGTSFFQAGQFSEAKRQYEMALDHWQRYGLERNDNVRTAETNLAHVLFLEGNIQRARARYQRLHAELSARGTRTPSFAALLIALGRTEALLGDPGLALQNIQAARTILIDKTGAAGPDALGAWINEIDVLQQLSANGNGLSSENTAALLSAKTTAWQIADKLPQSHPLRARLAVTDARQNQLDGKLEKAREIYTQAALILQSAPASMRPVHWRVLLYLAELEAAEQDFLAAKSYANEAQALISSLQNSDGIDFQESSAWLACLDQNPNAAQLLNQIAKIFSPSHPRILSLKACQQAL